MFRKAPLKTYQRKKPGGASTTINTNLIIREDISDNKSLQPKDFLAFKDTDKSLEYDPFDTTFDRIARDVIMPPIPPNPDDDSYSSSSNDANNRTLNDSDSEPLPNPLPIINPKPIARRCNFKKLKLDDDDDDVPTLKIELKTNSGKKKYRIKSSLDENSAPNILGKSGKRRKNTKEQKNITQNKKRRIEKPVVSGYRKKRQDKNLDRYGNFNNCSVNLTRVDNLVSKATPNSDFTANILNEKTDKSEKTGKKMVVFNLDKELNQETLDTNQSISLKVEKNISVSENPASKKLVDDQKSSSQEQEDTSIFKNPTVSLTRLNVPQLSTYVADKFWLNSTPMTKKTLRPHSSLHISPITIDRSMETIDHDDDDDDYEKRNVQLKQLSPKKSKSSILKDRCENASIIIDTSIKTINRDEDDSYETHNLPPDKPKIQSKKSKTSRFSNRRKFNENNSTKIKLLLSVSPDSEASGLMFDDTEIVPHAGSYISSKEIREENVTEASMMSPFRGFSKDPTQLLTANARPDFRIVETQIGDSNNTMDASVTSPFKGFTKDSTDSGSLHLTYDESDYSESPTKQVTRSPEKTRPNSYDRLTSTENQVNSINEVTDSVNIPEFKQIEKKSLMRISKVRLSRLETSKTNLQGMLKESAKGLKKSLEAKPKDLHNALEKCTEVLQNASDRSGKIGQSNSEERTEIVKTNSQKLTHVLPTNSQELTQVLPTNSQELTQVLPTNSQELTQVLPTNSQELTQILPTNSQELTQVLPTNSQELTQLLQSSLEESTEFLHNSTEESTDIMQNSLEESIKVRQDSLDRSTKDRLESSNEIAEDRQDSESTNDWQSSSNERLKGDLKSRKCKSIRNSKIHQDSSDDDSIDLQTRSNENLTTLNNSSMESSENRQASLNVSQKSQHHILDFSAYDTQNISKEIAKDWESSLDESSLSTEEQTNSDGEWETTTAESPKSNLSRAKSPKNIDNKFKRIHNKSIMQVSSDEGNTSYDGSVEFVNASQSFKQAEYSQIEYDSQTQSDSHQQELSSFKINGQSSKANTFLKSKPSIDESSIEKITNDKNLLKNITRNFVQPVIILSRCDVPIRASNEMSRYKNTPPNKANDSTKFIHDVNSENQNDDVEKSIDRSLVLKSAELINNNESSQESLVNMSSLRLDELSENGTEIEKATIKKLSQQDSNNCSIRLSIKKAANISASLSKKIYDDKSNEEESSQVAGVNMTKSIFDKTPVKISTEDTFGDSRTSIQPIVLLDRLNDPVRIGNRRKKYHNWGLSAILEDFATKNVTTIDEEPEDFESKEIDKNETNTKKMKKYPKMTLSGNRTNAISQETTVSCDASVMSNQSNASIREDKILFLKPGKSWSRSLSLYRQVHNQDDIETLAIGKGKKWRQSVQSVLDMQQQGVIQSCVKKNADDKESQSFYGVRNSAAAWIPGSIQPITSGVFSQTSVGSPGRFVRRISIRVVPDRKNSEQYEDSPFLEAYGITSFENRKTISKRSTLIAPRKTLVYNVNCADVSFENISKSINSVTSRDVVLAQCGQESSVPFDEFYPELYLKYCRKIGEGVFGEVFLYEKDGVKNVIKIIPIEGKQKVNGERQKKFDEILSEIIIAKELNNLRFADTCKTSSFVEVKNIRCVVGNYPPMLIDLWNTFDNEKNSENDCPAMFDKDQLYIVLELGHGGQDLEAFVFQNSSETHALFIQTALALAVAEEALEFEHRDLHWGNILISRTEDPQISYKLRGKDIKVASKGVKVSVIDFTLSRMSYQGCSIFNDLSLDDDLFAAQGEYQFEIYRLMRQKVENNWQTFEPFTNILWLHYTLDKMITAARYRRTCSKIHKTGINKLKILKDEIFSYKSAFDFVTNCDNMTRLQGSRSNVSTVSSTE